MIVKPDPPPEEGAAPRVLQEKVALRWQELAVQSGTDLSGFDSTVSLQRRADWARSQGLQVGGALTRFSTKLQHSTESQLMTNVDYAARNGIYVVPEYVCVDEAQTGRRTRRDGLSRMTAILKRKLIDVLLVFKVSRLLRTGYKSFAYVQENVVDEGMRCISVTQGIDTKDAKSWKGLLYVHGLMDDMLLDTTADHVRAELKNLFEQGFVTGALTVGYRREEIPGAPLTNRGLPRTRPVIDEPVAELIHKVFEMVTEGATLKSALKYWLANGGPCDPRSTTGRMSKEAFRRLLSNPRMLGVFEFGRKKNVWSGKRDYCMQQDQPDQEVTVIRNPELQIVDAATFARVQERLAKKKTGVRGPRKEEPKHLWDYVTPCFFCASCSTPNNPVRFYQTGSGNHDVMICKNGDLCSCKTALRRDKAVPAVCRRLQELLLSNAGLTKSIFCKAHSLDKHGDEALNGQIDACKSRLQKISQRVEDLFELVGSGSQEHRADTKSNLLLAQADKAKCQTELAELQASANRDRHPLLPEDVDQILSNLSTLLDDAASGKLGEDVIHKAQSVFERLTGGQIMVHVEPRAGRKCPSVRGTFVPQLLRVIADQAGAVEREDRENGEVEVWLREPPFLDRWAQRAHELVDLENESYRTAAKRMREEDGVDINSGKVWQLRDRYYEMIGQPKPSTAYNGGQPRKPRKTD